MENDEEYIPSEEEEEKEEYTKRKTKKKKALVKTKKKLRPRSNKMSFRWRLPDPQTWTSTVEQLRIENPILRDDERQLIRTLAIIMQEIEPPELKEGAYIEINDNLFR